MTSKNTEDVPSLPWRLGSSIVMGLTGTISRTFLLAGQRLEVYGLDEFLVLLDGRKDVEDRERGLITASNHLSILDDPLVWGSLPYKYQWNPKNHRWGLGSHDLMFKQRALCTFFSLGQVLPAHRLAHSPDGGPFQPTITQAIRLLSEARPRTGPPTEPTTPGSTRELDTKTHPEYSIPDPFTSGSSPYYYSSPSDPYAYQNPTYHSSYSNKAWVHIFPEGRIHQHPERLMRYHKWGIGRLILESDPAPLFVPIWIEGFENIMHESREFPRFVPRVGKDVSVTFGKGTSTEEGTFRELRERWRSLVERERTAVEHDFTQSMSRQSLGSRATDKVHEDELVEFDREEALAERLKNNAEAVHLREECTLKVREEVLKLRQARGWPDEDPKARLVDTWKAEGKLAKREGQMDDGSWIRDT